MEGVAAVAPWRNAGSDPTRATAACARAPYMRNLSDTDRPFRLGRGRQTETLKIKFLKLNYSSLKYFYSSTIICKYVFPAGSGRDVGGGRAGGGGSDGGARRGPGAAAAALRARALQPEHPREQPAAHARHSAPRRRRAAARPAAAAGGHALPLPRAPRRPRPLLQGGGAHRGRLLLLGAANARRPRRRAQPRTPRLLPARRARHRALTPDRQLEADTSLAVRITDENDLSPLFYPTEYEVVVPEDTPLHSSIARATTSGVVTITRALSASETARHEVTVVARDRASLLALGEAGAPAARASLVVRVRRVNLHAPELQVRTLPDLFENSTGEIYAIIHVTDQDSGDHGRIASLEIVDGDPDGHFRVRRSLQEGEYEVVVQALLDREAAPRGYNLTLRATDAGHPPRSSYLTLPVTLVDIDEMRRCSAERFTRRVFPETAPPNTPVIRLKVSDRDEGLNARVYIEIVGGNEGAEFVVNPDTDQGNAGTRKQSSAKVKITIVDSNDNDPVFEQDDMEVTVQKMVRAERSWREWSLKDADSGENAYISYSIANLQPVPFDVDHFSGAVRTSRVLDYERCEENIFYGYVLVTGDCPTDARQK
ncbi:hypothetical protein ACJJTC_012265 [Scirpophaga incertulas]